MISSIRFRNSGRNDSRSRRMQLLLQVVLRPLAARSGRAAPAKPSGPPRRVIRSEPRLLVMIRTVFLKSTVRPWPSVSRPSSSTWSRMLNTSGWAFSISSSRMTE